MKFLFALLTKLINFFVSPAKIVILKNSRRVRVLIVAENSVLLVKSSISSQKWSLPGGGIEKRESPAEAAAREVAEETGVVISTSDLKFIGKTPLPIKHSKATFNGLFFVAKLPKIAPVKIRRPLEILEVAWFKLDNLPSDHSPTLDVGLEFITQP